MRQAVILVGGRGTRLGAVAQNVPKPLAPIAGDVRFLDYLLFEIARHGIEEIVLLAGHLSHQVAARYEGRTVHGARLRVVTEPAPAGTGGALLQAAGVLDDVFLMANGDSLCDLNYLEIAAALSPKDLGALVLRRAPDGARFGRVELNGRRISGFYEKDPNFSGEALISAGVYALRRSVLDLITMMPCSLETDIFPALAKAGALAGLETKDFFIDIGLPETLAEARAVLPDKMRRGAAFFDRDGTLTLDANGYTHKAEDLQWQPGAIESIRACNDAGRFVIVVSNQSGIARGLYTEAQMHAFHVHMSEQLHAYGAHIDAFYFSPFHEDGAIPALALANHPDRKPNPGMLKRAMLQWPVAKEASFLIGDTEGDLDAARAVGIPGISVAPGELLEATKTALAAGPARAPKVSDHHARLRDRAALARAWLFDTALPLWWKAGFDASAGCFHEALYLDGSPARQPRRVRVQARQTIVYARAQALGWPGPWRAAVEAGVNVLVRRAIRPDGGTRHLLAPSGEPLDERRDLYDLAFVLLALSEASRALDGRKDLITAANNLLAWAEANGADAAGGFREGEVMPVPPRRQNPHMHMFEALLSLYESTGDVAHRNRANAIAALFRDKFCDSRGMLPEYFDDAWSALADAPAEPGHMFEWSWLLHRWQALGGEGLGEVPEQLRVNAEVYGVDAASGAVFDDIHLDGRPQTTTSRLWPHTERLKANLVRFERARDTSAAAAAVQAFDALQTYLDVQTPGLWRDVRNPDGSFVEEPAKASSFYHIIFALGELMRVAEAAE